MAHPAAKLSILAIGLLLAGLPTVERAPAAPAAPYPVATDTRLGGDESQTRTVMDLSTKVELRAFQRHVVAVLEKRGQACPQPQRAPGNPQLRPPVLR